MKAGIIIFTTCTLVAFNANAICTGFGNLRNCTDNAGNNYTINKIGNTTNVTGNNYRTGSNWSANSQKIGNFTYTNGRAANGNTWNSTTQKIGNSTYTSGQDSNGNYFSQTCNQFGCY